MIENDPFRASEIPNLQWNLSSIVNKHEDFEASLKGANYTDPDLRKRLAEELRTFGLVYGIFIRRLPPGQPKIKSHNLKYLILEALDPEKLEVSITSGESDPMDIWKEILPTGRSDFLALEVQRLFAWLVKARGDEYFVRLTGLHNMFKTPIEHELRSKNQFARADVKDVLPLLLRTVANNPDGPVSQILLI